MSLFKKRKIAIISLLLLSTTFNTSCSAFFGDDGYVITSTSTTEDDKGNIVLTINFSNDQQPVNVTIPKGLSGKDGVGIKKVTPTLLDDKVRITIEFTDDSIEDTVIEYPIIHGKGIESVDVQKDDIGNITIKFAYNDGTESESFTIPKGLDGNGILKIEPSNYNPLTKTTTYTITYTNGITTTFEVKDGADGISIMSIEVDEKASTDTDYVLKVTYSDDFVDTITLPKPKANTWLNGTSDYPDTSLGNNGDFYLNLLNGNVYLKENGSWNLKFSIKGEQEETVEPAAVLFWDYDDVGETIIETVPAIKGKNVKIEEIPIPVKENKTFLGWYSTKQNDKYAVNAGKFTNLTVVNSKTLIVYAWWK